MKKYFTKKVLIILVVALLIAIVSAVTVTVNDSGGGRIANGVNTLTKPFKKGMAAIVDVFEDLYDYLYKYDSMELENAALKERIAKLEQEARDFDAISQENEELRALLELSERNADYEFEAVSIISWSASNYDSSFTISKGENAGLSLHDCVITGSGQLIGQITELGTTTATVTTLIDPDTSLGAEIYEVSELAMAEGDFQLMKDGKLKLTYLDESSKVVAGQTVLTSGRTGTYPRGLVIGTVEDVRLDTLGLDDNAVIIPGADLEDLALIYVITDFGMDEYGDGYELGQI